MRPEQRGIFLLTMVGILTLLLILSVFFITLTRVERFQTTSGADRVRAKLLARSGVEYAVSRLVEHPGASGSIVNTPPEEDWRFRGDPSVPLGKSVNPSYNQDPYLDTDQNGRFNEGDAYRDPDGNQRYDGWSGHLRGTFALQSDRFKLRIGEAGSRIYVNGGALDELDRDPDGPAADSSLLEVQPGFVEVAPLQPNGIPDFRDAFNEGPNGFLVRLLNNLERIVTETENPTLGVEIVENRPVGGYGSLEALSGVLGADRYGRFKPFLTAWAWVDPKVIKPQPMNGRPHRWLDIDNPHRIGTKADVISGVTVQGGGNVQLHNSISGSGTEADPWVQRITASNGYEGVKTYPVWWERSFVYAWSQLRLGKVDLEPRQPVAVSHTSKEVLSSVLAGLKGTYLEVWDGTAGWDGGFGWSGTDDKKYGYPAENTTESPWHRTRVDYGMTYEKADSTRIAVTDPRPNGTTFFQQEVTTQRKERPWYGPANYDPHAAPRKAGGKPLIWSAPLGRLKECAPITVLQANAIIKQIRTYSDEVEHLRSWEGFRRFMDWLPVWEDVNEDGRMDGEPYPVTTYTGHVFERKMYRREDANSDGIFSRELFQRLQEMGGEGRGLWEDAGIGKDALGASYSAGVPGLTLYQKDMIRGMVNPNTALNDYNPDRNLWKEVDKSDVAGIENLPESYVHTTEFSLQESGMFSVQSLGEVWGKRGNDGSPEGKSGDRRLAIHTVSVVLALWEFQRDTTQADFMGAYNPGKPLAMPVHTVFSASSPSFQAPSGGQPLISHPEPQTVFSGTQRAADARYDGQISLGFIGVISRPELGETVLGDLFDTPHAMNLVPPDSAVPDLRGPYPFPLLAETGRISGNVFPDGVYSERERALKYPVFSNVDSSGSATGIYLAAWMKPNWFPEASPRPHALTSLSQATEYHYLGYVAEKDNRAPLDDILVTPLGLYFVPARNNRRSMEYQHDPYSTGEGWPPRSLLWGSTHSFFASGGLNETGMEEGEWRMESQKYGFGGQRCLKREKPVGRLERGRWQHVAMWGSIFEEPYHTFLFIGRKLASKDGTNPHWQSPGAKAGPLENLLGMHMDSTPNHIRFGEIAGVHNMNYAADATFANVRAGRVFRTMTYSTRGSKADDLNEHGVDPVDAKAGTPHQAFYSSSDNPAAIGRYYKEDGAVYTSSPVLTSLSLLEERKQPLRITWTEIPCDLWFDENDDGWLGDPPDYRPKNDRFGAGGSAGSNGLRDVHIELEVWDDMGMPLAFPYHRRLAWFNDPAGENRIPRPEGNLYYKAVFVNEWDDVTRLNHPLDVTPFLDDVTITYLRPGGLKILEYSE